MAERTVTLYIDDTSIRLMAAQGNQIKEWAEAALEPGLVENNVVVGEQAVAAKIKGLLEAQKINVKKVNLGLSGLRCLTRPSTLPKLPKEMLDEAVRREAQRVLPVPLEELYLSWQTIPGTAEQTRTFMVGVPIKIADALYRVLQKAGLRPGFMQIKPLLLTRLVKEPTSMIVDVQATEFDIVVLADGIPQPVRSVRFASGTLSNDEKLTAIKNEVNRSLAFYNSNNPEKNLASTVPVFISGDLANDSQLRQTLSEEVGHPVLPLESPLECPGGLDPAHFMANIGLACRKLPSEGKDGAAVISLNALPPVYQTKGVSVINVLALPGAFTAVGLLAFLALFVRNISADITATTSRQASVNQLLQQRQAQRQELAKSVEDLQKQINGFTAPRDSFIAVLGAIEKQGSGIAQDLTVAIESLPFSANMSSITHKAGILNVSGKALAERQVLSYITKLDKSGRFTSIAITDMTRSLEGSINFTVLGTLQTPGIGASSIEVALASLPSSVTLTNVKEDKGNLTINGTAATSNSVFAYLRALNASGKYSEITINSMTRIADGGMNFSILLKTGE